MPIFDFENQSLHKLNVIKTKTFDKIVDEYGAINIKITEISSKPIKIISAYPTIVNTDYCYVGRFSIINDVICMYIEDWNGDTRRNVKATITIIYCSK